MAKPLLHHARVSGFGGGYHPETVVQTSIVILAADLVLTKMLLPLTSVVNETVRHIF